MKGQGLVEDSKNIHMRMFVTFGVLVVSSPVSAQEDEGAAALAAKLQDPLASLAALTSDNTLGLRAGEDNDET